MDLYLAAKIAKKFFFLNFIDYSKNSRSQGTNKVLLSHLSLLSDLIERFGEENAEIVLKIRACCGRHCDVVLVWICRQEEKE